MRIHDFSDPSTFTCDPLPLFFEDRLLAGCALPTFDLRGAGHLIPVRIWPSNHCLLSAPGLSTGPSARLPLSTRLSTPGPCPWLLF